MLDRKVTIVSNNRETIDGVREYLHRAGARAAGAVLLEDAPAAAAGSDAVVFFADDYPRDRALATFANLRATQPTIRLVVVTEATEAFAAVLLPGAPSHGVVVLRRPAWGWMLLDAVRGGGVDDAQTS